jgi:ABC-type oligopeptide transport system substrate-binding subunit
MFVRDQLKANLGVTIALDPLDPNTLGSRLGAGAFEMAGPFGWTADYPDPADWFPIFQTTNSNDDSLYQNGRYDSLVGVAATDTQPARRQQEYREAQRQLLDDAPAAFLAQALSWHLVQPYVRGAVLNGVEDWPGEMAPATIYIADH